MYAVNENNSCLGCAVYICICNAVTQKAVEQCAKEGARSVDDLTARLGVGAGCGRCRECAVEFLVRIAAPARETKPA
jgi:bacterioferritin-associated ferredoxin